MSTPTPVIREYVDGAWSTPTVELGPVLEDPNTGTPIAAQLASSAEQVSRALTRAQAIHESGEWAASTAEARAAVLDAVADRVEAELDRIADLESLATGVVRSFTGMLGIITAGSFRLAAMQLREGILLDTTWDGPTGRKVEVHRYPLGVAVCLVPWNAPAPMAAHKVANALAAGCPTILKPSEWAPYGSTALVGAVVEALDAAGAPTSLLQLVHGGAAVGTQLAEDARTRAISFTGGLGGGRAIAAACAQDFTPAQLELGGNNALVILDDATPEATAAAVVGLMTSLNGQWCRALGRLLLPASRADELLAAVLDALASVTVGSSLDLSSQMGPIVHSGHLALLRSRLAELESAGGKAHAVTPLPDGPGNWLAPTLVTGVGLEATVHETFGPIAAVHTYDSVDEAVAIANGTPYGLESYVVGADEERALSVARQIRAGGVKVNGVSPISLHMMAPRPAWGLSGTGVEGTRETLQFFTGLQVVGVEGSLPG